MSLRSLLTTAYGDALKHPPKSEIIDSFLGIPETYTTRADFIADLANLTAAPDGKVVFAGGSVYLKKTGVTVIPDIPDWEPAGVFFLEYFGGGPSETAAVNDAAMAAAIAASPDTVEVNADTAENSSPWVRFGSSRIILSDGDWEFSQTVVVPFNKNIYLTCNAINSARWKYTGANRSMVRFEPRTIGGDFGVSNIMMQGGDIDVVGSSNGQIRFNDFHLAHAKEHGLWLMDSPYYYDDTYPAYDITGVATGATTTVTTSAAHGFANGDKVGIQHVKGAENANGTYYAGNVTATTFEVFTDAGTSLALDTSADSAYVSGGLVGLGYTGAGEGSGVNVNNALIENIEFSSSAGAMLTIEAATYALGVARKLRFGFSGKSPMVFDASGWDFQDLEFQSVDKDNYATDCYLHFPMEKVGFGGVSFGGMRFGSENPVGLYGGDYTLTDYTPPMRYICFGPLDGSAPKNSGTDLEFSNIRFYGENGADPDTMYMIDQNANINNVRFASGEARNVPAGGSFIKETAFTAGRQNGMGNTVFTDVKLQPGNFLGSWFDEDADGWEIHPIGLVYDRAEEPVITGLAGIGDATPIVPNSATWKNFLLTVTPTATGKSGTSVCTVELPFPVISAPLVQITPDNNATIDLGIFYTTNRTAGGAGVPASFDIRSRATMAVGTTYRMIVSVFINE